MAGGQIAESDCLWALWRWVQLPHTAWLGQLKERQSAEQARGFKPLPDQHRGCFKKNIMLAVKCIIKTLSQFWWSRHWEVAFVFFVLPYKFERDVKEPKLVFKECRGCKLRWRWRWWCCPSFTKQEVVVYRKRARKKNSKRIQQHNLVLGSIFFFICGYGNVW